MKLVLALTAALLLIGGTAYAWDNHSAFADGPVNLPDVRDDVYCQQPSGGWGVYNASEPFSSEEADDIPSNLAGIAIDGAVLYVGQWGGFSWQPFTNLIVNFYNQSCPPNQVADYSYTVPYADLNATQVYAGSWYVYQCTAPLTPPVVLGSAMSIGGIVDLNWGQNPPYAGLAITDYVFYGCELYWDAEYWGYSRWIPGSQYFGTQVDLAYCLQTGVPPIATEESSWGQVRSLFR